MKIHYYMENDSKFSILYTIEPSKLNDKRYMDRNLF